MTLGRPPDQDIVVIGASGDLAARKLLPALYNLSAEGLLPAHGDVVGAAPVDWDDAAFVTHVRESVAANSRSGLDADAFTAFAARLRFVRLGDDDNLAPLRQALGGRRRLVYLAVPSSAFATLVAALGVVGLAAGTSVIIEKPFGHDLESAKRLNDDLHHVLPEERIFRIDHYLGKETVQNLMVFRFGNSLWERVWNRDAVQRVEITVAETLGVEHRGAFYEETGALRDIVQNHLFQLLSVVCMEPPTSWDAESLRNEKVKVLNAVHPIRPADVVRGQYADGKVEGEYVRSYRAEPGVSPDSTTETFAALRLHVDSWRWAHVPVLLRTGKRLAERDTRVVLRLREVPLHFFGTGHRLVHNRLVVRIQPHEGISLYFIAKEPGPDVRTQPVRMHFDYGESFKASPPEAYERLLHDALRADHALFIREDAVERGWAIIAPVLAAPPPVHLYPAGSWGPMEADRLASPGRWEPPEEPEDGRG